MTEAIAPERSKSAKKKFRLLRPKTISQIRIVAKYAVPIIGQGIFRNFPNRLAKTPEQPYSKMDLLPQNHLLASKLSAPPP